MLTSYCALWLLIGAITAKEFSWL